MKLFSNILDRVILVAGVIIGGVIPSFIAQYRQRIGGALDQAIQDLAPFQEIANLRYGGSMPELVKHHLNSMDATFHGEGVAIANMVDAVDRLREASQALSGDLLHQLLFLLSRGDSKMAAATWKIFQPSFGLTAESLVLAGVVGVTLWMLIMGVWYGLMALIEIRNRGTLPSARSRSR